MTRKPSKLNLTAEKADFEEREYAVPDSDYFHSHHYRTSTLARKLGLPDQARIPTSLADPPKRSKKPWFSRRSRRKASVLVLGSPDTNPHLIGLSSKHAPVPGRARRLWRALPNFGVSQFFTLLGRHPLVPTRWSTILFTLGLVTMVVFSMTSFLIKVFDVDKEPLPWRTYCQEEREFPHAFADSLEPVNVFVGVFSVDAAYERRHLIRSTYARHSRPVDPMTGRPANNVQLKFVLGRPRAMHARRVALEMETFNDIVVLDIKENMNRGKTHAFFTWANENATVPVYYRQMPEQPPAKQGLNGIGGLHTGKGLEGLDGGETVKVGVGFRKADFVVKADDDSFIVLSELERHLRVAPREKTYWGYLIRNLFMGGECYALSADLVNYVATSEAVLSHLTGAEDKKVAKWLRIHPEASSVNWVTERCWMYDHPKAGTTYAHGFLFPDEVDRVRLEGRQGLTPEKVEARGGPVGAAAWSTVSTFKQLYNVPAKGLSMEEEVEALVEGGGRFSDGWKARELEPNSLVPWSKVVFEAGDERLRRAVAAADSARNRAAKPIGSGGATVAPEMAEFTPPVTDHYQESPLKFGRPPSDLMAELPMVDTPANSRLREAISKNSGSSSGGPETQTSSASSGTSLNDSPSSPPRGAHAIVQLPDRESSTPVAQKSPMENIYLSPPTLRYDPSVLELRQRRFMGLPYGGTVVVHYLKRNEWFLETSLVLLGRSKTWDSGITPAAYDPALIIPVSPSSPSSSGSRLSSGLELLDGSSTTTTNIELTDAPQWGSGDAVREVQGNLFGGARMFGSPIIEADGYIREGRPVGKVEREPEKQAEEEASKSTGWVRGSPRLRVGDMENGPRLPGAAGSSLSSVLAAAAATSSVDAASSSTSPEASPATTPKATAKGGKGGKGGKGKPQATSSSSTLTSEEEDPTLWAPDGLDQAPFMFTPLPTSTAE